MKLRGLMGLPGIAYALAASFAVAALAPISDPTDGVTGSRRVNRRPDRSAPKRQSDRKLKPNRLHVSRRVRRKHRRAAK